ncbi:MAG: peptidylprolyl isomerase [Aquabacterium sp.]|uniref:peptidylprolyl isomerase n=1 Tax=Aquabacterium sp. TaxID=1872578 RepID=UPI0025C48EDE|nr:peptidylprolyl isomerase [Aquabacterium sp.]MBI5926377.1 peptidylprolyl isomerase [Aquabacterium sp.]
MHLIHQTRRSMVRLGLCLWASLALHVGGAQAGSEPNGDPYPPNAYRCAVLAGGTGARFSDAKIDGFWREVNREVTGHVAESLRSGTYDIDIVFTDAKDEGKQPPKPLLAMARSRCAQLIQISHQVGDDKDGRFFAFDVAVLRFRGKGLGAASQPDAQVVGQEDYRKRYQYPLTDDVFKRFKIGQFAAEAFQDLIASGVIDGIKGATPITEAMMREEYERTVPPSAEMEYKARHILVDTQAQAQAVIKRIQAGESFDKLAKALSTDTGSGQDGGDLGWAGPGTYVKEFGQALMALAPKGLTEEPVQSTFGWHVIELQETRPTPRPSFDSMKAMITARLRQRARRGRQ